MSLTIRGMSRSHWPRVIDKDYTYMMIDDQFFKGAAGLIKINEVDKPATKVYDNIPVKIIDKGYYWLQIGPENQNYWITVMYNELGEIVQYYYDITDTNTILDNGESWFCDLMLDIVVLPDGKWFLLDEDELAQALRDNEITREQYDKAYLTANKIMAELEVRADYLKAACNTNFHTLKLKLKLIPKCHYREEKELSDFYIQMNRDCSNNHSRVIWEWLRNAPCLEEFQSDKFKLWKERGQVVCAVRPMSPWLGEAVIDNRCSTEETLYDVTRYVEANLSINQENQKSIFMVVLDKEDYFDQILRKEGYEPLSVDTGTLQYNLQKEKDPVTLEEGFRIHPLSEVYDFDQLSKLCWLGFDYEGDIPKIDDEVKLSIKHAWLNYNRDICSVVLDKNGDYASFCGFWYDETTQTAYLEPMVTLDKYRNIGLGKAVVFNSLKILQKLGCKKAFVDPDEEAYMYYIKIGFEPFEYARFYQKTF